MGEPSTGSSVRWAVVLPVKELGRAKSRLVDLTAARRADLALAMAGDVVSAALGCPAVAAVVVVTNDERAAAALGGLGAVVVPDEPDSGLNAALLAGARAARELLPDAGVAALASDLPALTSDELARTLEEAAHHERAVSTDAEGSGTTLLTAGPGVGLDPRYGPQSRTAHVASGAVLVGADAPGLARDVDTPDDLAAARVLGVGERTAAVMLAAS